MPDHLGPPVGPTPEGDPPPPAALIWARGVARARARRRRTGALAGAVGALALATFVAASLVARQEPPAVTTDVDQTTAPAPTTPAPGPGAPSRYVPPVPGAVPANEGEMPTIVTENLATRARAAFGDERFGGHVTDTSGTTYVLVVPEPGVPLPATFEGHPVVAAEYSFDQVVELGDRARALVPELAARGLSVRGTWFYFWVPAIAIDVADTTEATYDVVYEVLGPGPWILGASR